MNSRPNGQLSGRAVVVGVDTGWRRFNPMGLLAVLPHARKHLQPCITIGNSEAVQRLKAAAMYTAVPPLGLVAFQRQHTHLLPQPSGYRCLIHSANTTVGTTSRA